ncbi:MAG: hypothetical protein NTX50_08540 [Candidatus Sumerlaeota bacterium]|nr:hypothetical protein [Candidatus Sumerlaeota bacterium]
MKRAIAFLALAMAFAGFAAAQDPLNFQGKLTDINGQPLPRGLYAMEINFFDAATQGTNLWGPYFLDDATTLSGHGPVVLVSAQGRYSVNLGPQDTTGRLISDAFSSNGGCFVEAKVNGGEPILPRQQFLTTPYVFHLPAVFSKADQIGIGTTSPSVKLEVAGDIIASGDLYLAGNLTCAELTLSTSGETSGIGSAAVGSIVAWDKYLYVTVTSSTIPPYGWVECDGSPITDAESPLNGATTPDLNGATTTGLKGRFLRGDTTSGRLEDDALKSYTFHYLDSGFLQENNCWKGGACSGSYLGYSVDKARTMLYTGEETRPYNYSVVWIMRIK